MKTWFDGRRYFHILYEMAQDFYIPSSALDAGRPFPLSTERLGRFDLYLACLIMSGNIVAVLTLSAVRRDELSSAEGLVWRCAL